MASTYNNEWDNLSIEEKRDVIRVALKNGIRELPDIKAKYNEFAGGGSFYQRHRARWNNYLLRHGVPEQQAAKLSSFFSAQDALESGHGTSDAARRKNNFGGMQRLDKKSNKMVNISYPSVDAYMDAKWKMMQNRFGRALNANSIQEYSNLLNDPRYHGKGYMYALYEGYRDGKPLDVAKQTQHMNNYTRILMDIAGEKGFKGAPVPAGQAGEAPASIARPENPYTQYTPAEPFFNQNRTFVRPEDVRKAQEENALRMAESQNAAMQQERKQSVDSFNTLMSLLHTPNNSSSGILGTIATLASLNKNNRFDTGGFKQQPRQYIYDVLPSLFAKDGVKITVSSGFRPGAKTVEGKPSRHSLKQAADIVGDFKAIRRVLDDPNSYTSRWLLANGYGYLDETSATGTTKFWHDHKRDHSHYHIGMDSGIVSKYASMMNGRAQNPLPAQQNIVEQPIELAQTPDIPFTPSNPQAFFGVHPAQQQSVYDYVTTPTVEQPVYDPMVEEKNDALSNLSKINAIMQLTSPSNSGNNNFLNTVGLLANMSAEGGPIHIKPENRGKFTALKERTGHSATWFKEHGTPAQKKMATFALNARHWKHGYGGNLYDDGGDIENRPPIVPFRQREEVIITPDSEYNKYLNTLPDNQRFTPNDKYDSYLYWKLNGKPRNFKEAYDKGMFNYDHSDNGYHANSIAWGKDGIGYFMKPKTHDTVHMETDWFNKGLVTEEGGWQRPETFSEWKESKDFRDNYDLVDDPNRPNFYKYQPKKHADGGNLFSGEEEGSQQMKGKEGAARSYTIDGITYGAPYYNYDEPGRPLYRNATLPEIVITPPDWNFEREKEKALIRKRKNSKYGYIPETPGMKVYDATKKSKVRKAADKVLDFLGFTESDQQRLLSDLQYLGLAAEGGENGTTYGVVAPGVLNGTPVGKGVNTGVEVLSKKAAVKNLTPTQRIFKFLGKDVPTEKASEWIKPEGVSEAKAARWSMRHKIVRDHPLIADLRAQGVDVEKIGLDDLKKLQELRKQAIKDAFETSDGRYAITDATSGAKLYGENVGDIVGLDKDNYLGRTALGLANPFYGLSPNMVYKGGKAATELGKSMLNAGKNEVQYTARVVDNTADNVLAAASDYPFKYEIGTNDKVDQYLTRRRYSDKIHGKPTKSFLDFDPVTGDFAQSNERFAPDVVKGLPTYTQEDLMHNTVGRNMDAFINEGVTAEEAQAYVDRAKKAMEDVHVGRYSNYDYEKAGYDKTGGFYDDKNNFISVNDGSSFPKGFVEKHEGRHLIDYQADDAVLMPEITGSDYDADKVANLMQRAKQKQNMVLGDAYDNDFLTIPESKFAEGLESYSHMSREAVTTNRDARDVLFAKHNFGKQDRFLQNKYIDKMSDDDIFDAVSKANGYGRRYIERLKAEGKLTPKKAKQFREAMKYVGAVAAPVSVGLTAAGISSKTSDKR